jgi:N-acetylneuraminate synthase
MADHAYFIAEIGINHNGDINLAKRLIDIAAEAGCDAVKFQKRTLSRVYTAAELARPRRSIFGSTNRDLKEGLEFGAPEYSELFRYSHRAGIDCFASVWDEESVKFVKKFRPPYLKVPSPLIRHRGLLQACRESRIPTLISTGGADLDEVNFAVCETGSPAGVMHCVSGYPCPEGHSNIRQMTTLKSTFGLPVGYSSHELEPHAVLAATALGAVFLERHITENRRLWGSDQSISTEPGELADLIAGVRAVERSLGSPEVRRLPIEEPALAKLARVHDCPASETDGAF